MRLLIAAVGRLKAGPERDLAQLYHQRMVQTGRLLGWRGFEVAEVDDSRKSDALLRKQEEAHRLEAVIPAHSQRIVLDERGKNLTSPAFAALLHQRQSAGDDLSFVIGGPDGVDESLRCGSSIVLCLGAMTWPHRLARVMLLEQLYRSATILGGHPYHRI